MRGRLDEQTLDRMVAHTASLLHLAAQLDESRKPQRVIDQLVESCTAPLPAMFEAHEAVNTADYVERLTVASLALSATRGWLLLIEKSAWVDAEELEPLLSESIELHRVVKTLIVRARRKRATPRK